MLISYICCCLWLNLFLGGQKGIGFHVSRDNGRRIVSNEYSLEVGSISCHTVYERMQTESVENRLLVRFQFQLIPQTVQQLSQADSLCTCFWWSET